MRRGIYKKEENTIQRRNGNGTRGYCSTDTTTSALDSASVPRRPEVAKGDDTCRKLTFLGESGIRRDRRMRTCAEKCREESRRISNSFLCLPPLPPGSDEFQISRRRGLLIRSRSENVDFARRTGVLQQHWYLFAREIAQSIEIDRDEHRRERERETGFSPSDAAYRGKIYSSVFYRQDCGHRSEARKDERNGSLRKNRGPRFARSILGRRTLEIGGELLSSIERSSGQLTGIPRATTVDRKTGSRNACGNKDGFRSPRGRLTL